MWQRHYRLAAVCTIPVRRANHARTLPALSRGPGQTRAQENSMAADASGRHLGGRITRRQVAGAGLVALGSSALAGGSFGLVRSTRAQSQGEPQSPLVTNAGPNPWREPPILMSVDGLLDVQL